MRRQELALALGSASGVLGGLDACLPAAIRQVGTMHLAVEAKEEADGRWIAEIAQIPGALAYGSNR